MDGPGAAFVSGHPRFRAHVERLLDLAKGGMTLGLESMAAVLERLGHPERGLPCVHVAGSNGKGSTSAFLASILSRRGRRIGLYTSPHLVSLTERVQLVEDRRARPIEEEALADALDAVDAVAPGFSGLSFFEALTAAGLVALSRAGVAAAAIEAGLGARLDATRLVEAEVAVLTDLALEHTEILGDTLADIAREKSAVARPARPLVSAGGPPEVLAVIEGAAAAVGAPLVLLGRDFAAALRPDGRFDFRLGDRTLAGVRLALAGPHQGRNAAIAAQAALLFDPGLEDADLRDGLERAQWPGRMEVFAHPGRPPVLLDGAHNADGAAALAAALAADPQRFATPLHLVFGVLRDKDAGRMLAALEPLAATLTLAAPSSPRARIPEDLLDLLPAAARAKATVIAGDIAAVEHALARAAGEGGWVVVCGSLYLVGAVRAWLLTWT